MAGEERAKNENENPFTLNIIEKNKIQEIN